MNALKTHISGLNFLQQLDDVKVLINGARGKITFWGGRVIEVASYKGSVSLNHIAKKIENASATRCNNDDLTLAERVAGLDIVKKIKELYTETDDQLKRATFLTRFFCWIRETFSSSVRLHFSQTIASRFCAFSEAKFREQFPGETNYNSRSVYPSSEGILKSPNRILAKEQRIRELANPTNSSSSLPNDQTPPNLPSSSASSSSSSSSSSSGSTSSSSSSSSSSGGKVGLEKESSQNGKGPNALVVELELEKTTSQYSIGANEFDLANEQPLACTFHAIHAIRYIGDRFDTFVQRIQRKRVESLSAAQRKIIGKGLKSHQEAVGVNKSFIKGADIEDIIKGWPAFLDAVSLEFGDTQEPTDVGEDKPKNVEVAVKAVVNELMGKEEKRCAWLKTDNDVSFALICRGDKAIVFDSHYNKIVRVIGKEAMEGFLRKKISSNPDADAIRFTYALGRFK